MSSERRVQGLASKISIFLLAVILLIAVGIFLKQMHWDMSRFGLNTTDSTSLANSRAIQREQELLNSLEIDGFQKLSETGFYTAENLYEIIDGKAPLYLESGFRKLFNLRLVSKSDENSWMKILLFDMGQIKNAFSVFSTQRRIGAENIPDLQFAYKTTNGCYFVNGKYYTEITGSSEDKQLFSAILKVGKKTNNNLNVDGNKKIEEINWFPKKNLIPDTIMLYLSGAFSFAEFKEVFTAKYKFEQENTTAFFGKTKNPQDARKLAQRYKTFLVNNGAAVTGKQEATKEAVILDYYGTTEIIFTAGPFVGGVHQAENQKLAEQTAIILFNKLNEISRGLKIE